MLNALEKLAIHTIPIKQILSTKAGGGNGNPLQYSCLENPKDRGAWQAAGYRVTKSQTTTERLSTHTHIYQRHHLLVDSFIHYMNIGLFRTWVMALGQSLIIREWGRYDFFCAYEPQIIT